MEKIREFLTEGWQDELGREEKRIFLWCIGMTFFWGLLAHAYGFLHDSFSHDVLNALFADNIETYWKMQLGRFGTVIYRRLIRVPLTMPWLLGVLSLAWVSCALFLMAKLFHLKSRFALFLAAGVLTVNLSMIAMTATYIYEMDMNMLALLVGVAAVFLWARYGWPGAIFGIFLTAGVLSVYQSYVSVVIGLIMLYSILRLASGSSFKEVFLPGLRGILMIGLGGGLYYFLLRLMARLKDISLDTGSYNSVYSALEPQSVGLGLTASLAAAYRNFAQSFLRPQVSHFSQGITVLNAALLILCLVLVVGFLLNRGRGIKEKLLALVLLLLLPLGLNTARVFSGRDVHDLMKYAFWLLYLLPLLLAREGVISLAPLRRTVSVLVSAGLLLLLWGNTQTANAVYVKKNLEQEASLSLMTRVLERMESREDYVPGETPLVFVGSGGPMNETIYGFQEYYGITGSEEPCVIPFSDATYYYNAYGAYFRYVLNTKAVMADHQKWTELQTDRRVQEMSAYPGADCMRMIDGILVVKLGEPVDWSANQ